MVTVGMRGAAAILALAVVAPVDLAAQVPDWLFPDRALLPTLMAGPRDPVIQGQLVYDWESPTEFAPGASGEAALAAAVPVVRLAGSSDQDALAVGLEGAAFARFAFQVVTRELVNTDWIFAVPLVWHRGRHWLRLRYYHTSSHLGDEYQSRFGPASVNFARDGVDVTVYIRPEAGGTGSGVDAGAAGLGLGLYGLVYRSVSSHPEETGLWEARVGLELDPGRGGLWQPFLTTDLHVEEGTGWDPRWTVQTGIWLPAVQGRPLGLALQAITGPSPMGQFRDVHQGRVGVGLFWNR